MRGGKINQDQQFQKKSASIGALLVSARNNASLSQADISDQLNLPLQTINALEKDDFSVLPEATYIRGYLRNYARIVGINADGLIKVFDKEYVIEPVIQNPIKSKQSYDAAILWSTAAVFSILVGLVITWWIEYNPVEAQNVETQVVSNTINDPQHDQPKQEQESESTDAQEELLTDQVSFTPIETSENEVNTEELTELEMQKAIQEQPVNSNLLSFNDDAHTLTVTYMEESWTEIRDADANTLMQGLIQPGVVRNLTGKPPFEIFLGNSPGVVVEINGLYFDHSHFSRSNRTARFQVSSGSLN